MPRFKIFSICFISILLTAIAKPTEVIIYKEKKHELDKNLFGHFLEKPSWGGEVGIEAAFDLKNDKLQKGVVEKLKGLNIPILRFPGGTDIDYLNWQDMVDNIPGRTKERPLSTPRGHEPVSNHFGYDEFMELCESLSIEALLVLNLGQAVFKQVSIEEAVENVLSLLAYVNSPTNNSLPETYRQWPELREKNGKTKPWPLEYVQIGNETWYFFNDRFDIAWAKNRKEKIDHYVRCVVAYVEAIEMHFPHIKIIVDTIAPDVNEAMAAVMGDRVDYWVHHEYSPWQVSTVIQTEQAQILSPNELSEKEIWNTWVSTPGNFDEYGMAQFEIPVFHWVRSNHYQMAFTEWNWNGWWGKNSYYEWQIIDGKPIYQELTDEEKQSFSPDLAKALGAASYLHSFIRNADIIKMACQSMTVGSSWGITGIRVDPSAQTPPYYLPSSQVVGLYAKYHGTHTLKQKHKNTPGYSQPFSMRSISASEKVAFLDVVSTSDEKNLYIHVINRDFSEDRELKVKLRHMKLDTSSEANLISLVGVLSKDERPSSNEQAWIEEQSLKLNKKRSLRVNVPKRSVSVVVLPLN